MSDMTPLRAFEIIIYSLLNLLPYIVLALFMFKDKMRFGKKGTSWLIIILAVLQVFIGFAATTFFKSHTSTISMMSYVLFMVFYIVAVKASISQLAFMAFLIANYASFIVTVSKGTEYILFPDMAMQGYRWTFSLMTIIVQAISLPPLTLFIDKQIRPALNMSNSQKLWRYLWIIPFTFYLVWFYALYIANNGTTAMEIATNPTSSLYLLLINLGSLVVYYAVAKMVCDDAERERLEKEKHDFEMRKLQVAHLEDRIDEARRSRHDMRQHLRLLLTYCDLNKTEDIRKYLETLCGKIDETGSLQYCRNQALNAVLVYYADKAMNEGAAVTANIRIPEETGIPETEMVVLFGNLLENAVDAIRRQSEGGKRLDISALQGNKLVITVDNTYSGEIKQSGLGKFISSKRNSLGTGTESVTKICEKYGGFAKFEYENGMFQASCLLYLDEKYGIKSNRA